MAYRIKRHLKIMILSLGSTDLGNAKDKKERS
jgi:hypothetical protein